MTSWENTIGEFEDLKTKACEDTIGRCFLSFMLGRRQDITTQYQDKRDHFEDPYQDKMTLDQYLVPPEKGKKHMWNGTIQEKVLVTDKKTGKKVTKMDNGKIVYKEKKGSFPVKGFGTVRPDTRTFIVGLLNMYLTEVLACYNDNDKSFANTDKVLGQLTRYASENFMAGESVTALVIHTCSLMSADTLIKDDDVSSAKIPVLSEYLLKRGGYYFKNKKGKPPTPQLEVIIGAFTQFLKIIAVQMMDGKWGTHVGNVNVTDFTGTIRQLCNVLHEQDIEYPYDVFAEIHKWIEAIEKNSAVAKAKRAKKTPTSKKTSSKKTPTKSTSSKSKSTSSKSKKTPTKSKTKSKVNSKKVEEELENLESSDADSDADSEADSNDGSEDDASNHSADDSSIDDTAPSDQEVDFSE